MAIDYAKQKALAHTVRRPITFDASGRVKSHPLSGKVIRPTDKLETPVTFEHLTDDEYEAVLGTGAIAPSKGGK